MRLYRGRIPTSPSLSLICDRFIVLRFPMNTTRYYYANELNQPVGPFTAADLLKFHKLGIVTDDTLISLEDGSDWVPLATLYRSVVSPSSGPPPIPSSASTAQPLPAPPAGGGRSSYQRTAETVGMVPDLSGTRNLLQLKIAIPITIAFALFGFLTGGLSNGLIWCFGGLLIGVLVSGTVLMVLGWKNG